LGKPKEVDLAEDIFAHPLIEKLCALAVTLSRTHLLIVFPKLTGWGQVSPHPAPDTPGFCQVIRRTKDGAKHCRMCHILMAISACSNKMMIEQTCHAGASVLVAPMSTGNGECFAVLSSCIFAPAGGSTKWPDVRARAKKLGLDAKSARAAFDMLMKLTDEEIAAAKDIMIATAEAAGVLAVRAREKQELAQLQRSHQAGMQVEEAVERELRSRPSATVCSQSSDESERNMPAAVRVVTTLVRQKPNMPFNVAEIASAARMSPNHFSSLFRKHQNQSFSEFLTQQRIEMAKDLLCDLTMNIAEVARNVGYDDAGYFARRFRQKTGMTPREWRTSRAVSTV